MKRNATLFPRAITGMIVLCASGPLALRAQAQQTLWLEEFDGGTTTTGFTVDNNVSDCYWVYAPDSVHDGMSFNQDFGGAWPAGPGFDSSFVFLDSDECGGTSVVVNSFLNSPQFDASAPGSYTLTFAQQFFARLQSFTRIEAWNGSVWTEVYYATGSDVGHPNPAVITSLDITNETGGSAAAQVRFQFSAGWDWWWALDSISVTYTDNVGLDELAAHGMRVSPVPATDDLTIAHAPAGTVAYQVFTVLGARVLEQAATATLSVRALAPGIYILYAVDGRDQPKARVRFVKE